MRSSKIYRAAREYLGLRKEDVCAIKTKVQDGTIDKGRYERYVYIYEKLKEKYDRKYK